MPVINKIIYRKSTKAAVFIDAANVIYSQRTLKWQIDFKKLMDYFKTHPETVPASLSSVEGEKRGPTDHVVRR